MYFNLQKKVIQFAPRKISQFDDKTINTKYQDINNISSEK